MRRINKIILHYSETPEGVEFSAKDIERWHIERGFNCIGYHYVVKLDGTIERGRPEEQVGAHCSGQNQSSIGICYIGGILKGNKHGDTRTVEQMNALEGLLRELHTRYPKAELCGHNEFSTKSCPGFDVKKDKLYEIWKSL